MRPDGPAEHGAAMTKVFDALFVPWLALGQKYNFVELG
jgi:hypothetical protein